MIRNKHRQASLESLENRKLMSVSTLSGTFVYVEANDPFQGQNSILAYSENTKTGALTAVANGRYFTGGTGNRNAGANLGPDDSDKEVIATPDGNYLFAVNQGSNSVAEFAIQSDGSLKLVKGAPFGSGGDEPVSLSFSNDRLYVVNKGNSALGVAGTIAPTVTSFYVGEDGKLISIPDSTVTLPLNLSPAQVLVSADGRFAFVNNFATPDNLKVSLADTIEPFLINSYGSLNAVSGGAAGLPSSSPPLLLGLVEDPVHHLIYAGLPTPDSGGIATFSYSSTGKVSYDGELVTTGHATCWLNISPNGKFLYATDSASDAISVYSLANPVKPKQVQEFDLNGPTTGPYDRTATGPTSQDFQFSFDPSGNYIWVLNHTTDDGFQQGNQLHSLKVSSNGLLSETGSSPLFFPRNWVPGEAKVFGLAVVTPAGGYGGYASTAAATGAQLANAQPAVSIASIFSSDESKTDKLLRQLLDEIVT